MAYVSVNIEIQKKNNGIKIEDLKKYLQSLSNNVVSIGVHRDAGRENVKKMLWNEFGTNHRLKYDSVAIQNVGLKPLTNKTAQFLAEDFSNLVEKGIDISIPARPVVRMYLYQDIKKEISNEYQLAINRQLRLKVQSPESNADKTLKNLGQECVFMQREKMTNGNFAPVDTKGKDQNNNSPLTQYIKGFNHPYFKTGELISKIDYKIGKRGS